MIQIYSKGNKNFQQNGDVTLLSDDAIVRVELNGAWNLELHHPIDEKGRWKYLVEDAVIKAPSFNGDQLFRIYKKEKSDDGVSVQAYPIFFDAKNDCFLVDVRPTNKNGQDALNIMCSVNSKYSASSDIARMSTSYFEYMNLLEAINGDSQNSFLRRWGGEVLYDNFKIIVNEQVGADYGVEIRYGKNIPANGVREEIDMTEVVTRIYPKAFNGRKLTSGFVDSPLIGNYETVRVSTMKFENIKLRSDLEGDGTEENVIICDTQAELDAELTKKCKEQFDLGLDKPKITIDADMVLLQNTEEYKDYKILENVSLGDTVHCKHNKLVIVTDARVISLEYDCLLDRVTSVKLGDFKKNYFDGVTDNVNKIESVITPDGGLMADKVEGILNAMKTQLKYQKDVAHKQDVRAIFFEDLDTESPTYGAMCLGTQGFQISRKRTADGRDWDWTTAGTAHGFNADTFITGTLTDKTGKNFWNLDTGEFQLVGAGGEQTDWQDKIDDAQQNAIDAANKALIEYANTIKADMNTLQKQVDGQVEDWYYDYEPTPNNVPASNWSTEEDKKKHEGDRFFWKSKGYAYRWMKDGDTWKWVLLQDTDITKALQEAANAKDIADGKRRTFITEPTAPYDVGDLWFDGVDILTCTNPRVQGGYFYRGDWEKLNHYTDDTVANEALGNSQNPDKFLSQQQVFNKLTNNGAIKGIFMRNGQLYFNGTYIQSESISGEAIKANSITSDKMDVETLSAITAILGEVFSATITNSDDGGTNILKIIKNTIQFIDFNSATEEPVATIELDKANPDMPALTINFLRLALKSINGNALIYMDGDEIFVQARDININGLDHNDTGWVDCTMGNGIEPYGSYDDRPQVRRIGRMVFLRGTVRNNTSWQTHASFITIPEGFRPPIKSVFVMQGSGSCRYTINIGVDGKVTADRYSNDTTMNQTVPTGSWLNMYCSWLID